MKYKLLVVDVDGTLLNDKKEICLDEGAANGCAYCIIVRTSYRRYPSVGEGIGAE